MFRHGWKYLFLIFIFSLFFYSCPSGTSATRDTTLQTERTEGDRPQAASGLAEEIRTLTESGLLASMLQAIDLIQTRNLSGSEFGRTMSGINVLLIRLVYPDSPARLPQIDLPQTSAYTRIIREAERGVYTSPAAASNDFFEHILPFLAVREEVAADIAQAALRDLEKAATLRPASVLPHFFRGLVFERTGNVREAEAAYRRAVEISADCYSAQIGIARLRRRAGNHREAIALFSDLAVRYPDSIEIRYQLAVTYFESGDLTRAGSAAEEILRSQPRNGEFLLLRSAILIEQGQFTQANAALDTYAAINANDRNYLFMRARVQAEGMRNRDAALNYLRSILRVNPNDTQVLVYAATLLMESTRAQDQTEGREMLERLRRTQGSSVEVLSLSLRDAVRREAWQEAQGFLTRILATRRTVQDLQDAYRIERGLGNNSRALTFARELYDRDSNNHEFTIIYISALIDNNRREEASRLIESRVNAAPAGALKSRYFFQRSRLQTNQDNAITHLRSALFEDPRNMEALIAIFLIYHNRREERRAVHYLRQALAIAPDHPQLRRYEREYASLLGRN